MLLLICWLCSVKRSVNNLKKSYVDIVLQFLAGFLGATERWLAAYLTFNAVLKHAWY